MKIRDAVHVGPAMIALAVTVALSAGASPAGAAAGVPRDKPIDDPHQYGEWIADVERPAEQYRGRLQVQIGEARALLGP